MLSLKELDKTLLNEGKGGSLESIYERVPQMLKGLVELVYDLNNHPSMRLIEPLFYKAYYTDSHQELALGQVESDFTCPRCRLPGKVDSNFP